jgi:hypothetical protein
LSVAKATSCLNTSCCERQLAFKNGGGARKSPSQLPLLAGAKWRPPAAGAQARFKSLVTRRDDTVAVANRV